MSKEPKPNFDPAQGSVPSVGSAAAETNPTENMHKEKTDDPVGEKDRMDTLSFIREMKHSRSGMFEQYDVLLDTRIYGWQTILNRADYLLKTDIDHVASVTVADLGGEEIELIEQYKASGTDILNFADTARERNMLSVAGSSRALKDMVKFVWLNQTRTFRLFCMTGDEDRVRRYLESACSGNFGTEDEMKPALPLEAQPPADEDTPVTIDGEAIRIDTQKFYAWKKAHPDTLQYEFRGHVHLTQKEPILSLLEDGVKTREYCLQTEQDEDFKDKYFLISVRLSLMDAEGVPVAQIDGFIADTPEDREIRSSDIGFRMECHFLACGGEASEKAYCKTKGRDLVEKGLKYPGYTTTSNIRLIGVCAECKKSFAFHGYALYLAQSDVAYSDNGLDVCDIPDPGIDPQTWRQMIDGKMFRYYNSFCCPHCGKPYIDYNKYPEMKQVGVSGCCHLGRKVLHAASEPKPFKNEPQSADLSGSGSQNIHAAQETSGKKRSSRKSRRNRRRETSRNKTADLFRKTAKAKRTKRTKATQILRRSCFLWE